METQDITIANENEHQNNPSAIINDKSDAQIVEDITHYGAVQDSDETVTEIQKTPSANEESGAHLCKEITQKKGDMVSQGIQETPSANKDNSDAQLNEENNQMGPVCVVNGTKPKRMMTRKAPQGKEPSK